ncbi:heterogeneous nuclear ribonucleoproteins A2/B1-like, partial [Amphibalanus amphitrite]|uniref:heterogeneous nuclear ribonucleoproteins A2/B1-like n=1 Tax=Amphibalanus amphitrite TaxID=1232801 RepID=UPI001C910D2D
AVVTTLAARLTSAAYRSSCFGGRCGFQSGNNGFHSFQSRFSQSQFPGGGSSGYSHRFGPARSPFGPSPNPFGPAPGGFGSGGRFGPNHFGSSHFSSSRSRFSSPSFGPSPRHFGSPSHFNSPSGGFGRFGRFGSHSSLPSRLNGISADQQYQAQLATSRQLAHRRRQEQHLIQSHTGIVQPGSPSAALAAEKRADPKSLALGNQALQQILYLQNLVGSVRRR